MVHVSILIIIIIIIIQERAVQFAETLTKLYSQALAARKLSSLERAAFVCNNDVKRIHGMRINFARVVHSAEWIRKPNEGGEREREREWLLRSNEGKTPDGFVHAREMAPITSRLFKLGRKTLEILNIQRVAHADVLRHRITPAMGEIPPDRKQRPLGPKDRKIIPEASPGKTIPRRVNSFAFESRRCGLADVYNVSFSSGPYYHFRVASCRTDPRGFRTAAPLAARIKIKELSTALPDLFRECIR